MRSVVACVLFPMMAISATVGPLPQSDCADTEVVLVADRKPGFCVVVR